MIKLKQIASRCKKRGLIYLCDDDRNKIQWVGDGKAFYPLTNIPHLEMKNLITLFEIKEKQLEKIETQHINIRDIEGLSFDDTEAEHLVTPENIGIVLNGVSLEVLKTSVGVVYIDSSALAPLANMFEMLELYERRNQDTGESYIACKTGFILQGIIAAENIISPSYVEQLERISHITNMELELRRMKKETGKNEE